MVRSAIVRPQISDVMRHYGYDIPPLRTSGWTKIRCPLPFHDDKRPSASVSSETNRWHCMTCDVIEDSLDIICREENVGVSRAREIAQERFGTGSDKVSGKPEPSSQVSLFTRDSGVGGTSRSTRGLF